MVNTFDPATIDFHGEEVRALAETVFEGFFSKPSLTAFHRLVPGIKAKKQVVILGAFTGLLGLGDGSCEPTPNDAGFAASQKFWNPATISDRIERCWKGDGGLEETFFIWGTKNGIAKADLTGTEYFLFLTDILEDAMAETILRLAYFGDTAADTFANSGNITNGTPLAAFDRIDGFFVQIFALVAADATKKTAGLATKNAAASYALQKFNSTDTTNQVVTTTLADMETDADYRLRDAADKVFIVTMSVFDQYKRELKKISQPFTIELITNGIQSLSSDGIEVIGMSFLDRMIKAYQNNGTKYYLPHRAILTTKTNLQIGTEEESTFTEFEAFYDKVSKKSMIDFQFDIDAQIGLDHLIQVAY
jgi:hypothetical protein